MNNEPAFSTSVANESYVGTPGLTLRDYFAAKAMQGAIASLREGGDFTELGCEWAYNIADGMLKARKQ